MRKISIEEALARARAELGLEPDIPALACPVRRLDRDEESYFLIVFGDDQASIAVIALDARNGEPRASARLPGDRPHLTIDAAQALALAAPAQLAEIELVWQPCRASLSPLYPIWQVQSAEKVSYVDQSGVVWPKLEPGGSPGG